MEEPKAKWIIIALVIGVIAAVFVGVYRSRKEPADVVDRVLHNWRPGYHNLVEADWKPDAPYSPLYRVKEYHIHDLKLHGSSAEVIARVNHITGHKEQVDAMYTFFLEKTTQGWKVVRYQKGFKKQ